MGGHYQSQSRTSARSNTSKSQNLAFTPPQVVQLQPKKKAAKQLPEWRPEGNGMPSPLERLVAQAKLTIGQPNDQYEQEADRVAQNVVQRINAPTSKSPQPDAVQRETEEELQTKPLLQRKPITGDAAPDLESEIHRVKGKGQSLDTGLQRAMGEAMGADFSGVKVHTDARSDQMNQSIQAKAFTTGKDVFFKQGAYQPGNREGQELIAHELTHVVQQGAAKSTSPQVQTVRERSDAITEAPDLSFLDKPVAKLHMCVDLDAPGMSLPKQLLEGEVGHAWVSLEWNDPSDVPEGLPAAHKKQLETGGDPFGFWPKKFDWLDYSGMSRAEIWSQLWIDNKDSYNELYQDLQEEYPDMTHDEIMDEVTQKLTEDTDMAETWGGFHIESDDAVGYSSNPFKSYVAGQVLHPDYMHNAKAIQTYDVTIGEVNRVLEYAESKQTADYSVFYYNCTTFAQEAVQAAGKPAPKAGHLGVCYPDKLYKSIKKNYEKGKGHTFLEVKDKMKEKIGPALEAKKKKK